MVDPSSSDPAMPAMYVNAPVRLVVLSVEHPPIDATDGALGGLRDALRDRFPLVDRQAEARLTFEVGPASTAHQEVVTIPSFSTRDRSTRVVVTPERTVIETRSYQEFGWYTDLIAHTLGAVGRVLAPDGVTAIGHRFIDEVRLPGPPSDDLARWFDPALLAMPGLIEPRSTQWQAVISHQTNQESRLTLRYGPLQTSLVPDLDGSIAAFNDLVIGLDWDSRWVPMTVPEFDIATIVDRVATMYEPVRSLFRRICTDELRERFATTVVGG